MRHRPELCRCALPQLAAIRNAQCRVLKFRFSIKATKFDLILHLDLKFTIKSYFVASSEIQNFSRLYVFQHQGTLLIWMCFPHCVDLLRHELSISNKALYYKVCNNDKISTVLNIFYKHTWPQSCVGRQKKSFAWLVTYFLPNSLSEHE